MNQSFNKRCETCCHWAIDDVLKGKTGWCVRLRNYSRPSFSMSSLDYCSKWINKPVTKPHDSIPCTIAHEVLKDFLVTYLNYLEKYPSAIHTDGHVYDLVIGIEKCLQKLTGDEL